MFVYKTKASNLSHNFQSAEYINLQNSLMLITLGVLGFNSFQLGY